jgi:hypothetical protein
MPILDATTTAVFDSVGITATSLYTMLQTLIGMSISFGIWLIELTFPFLLVLAFIGVIVGLVYAFLHFGKHRRVS